MPREDMRYSGNGFTLNDLPRYTPWAARLLGREEWTQRRQTAEEVARQYEIEQWAPLLERVRSEAPDARIGDVDRWVFSASEIMCCVKGGFTVLSAFIANTFYHNLIDEALARYLPASALVELGAGYGSVLLTLAQRERYRGVPLIAADFSSSGRELTRVLAANQGSEIAVGWCDFNAAEVTDREIPEDALILTSSVFPSVPDLTENFFRTLTRMKPRAVVHAEPCYDHFTDDTLWGMMVRRYIEVNDYNRNFLSLLRDLEKQGEIEILHEDPAVFGFKALLPHSIVIWRPVQQ